MAQNYFNNVTADKGVSTKDPSQHAHLVNGSTTTPSGDLTLSYDTTVVTTVAILDSLVKAARARAIANGLK